MTIRQPSDTSGISRARRVAPKLLGLALTLLLSQGLTAAGEQAARAPLDLQYRLRLLRPTTHLLEVEISARNVHEPTLEFAMPAWSPGRYAIYDFAKNVQDFAAAGERDQVLAWRKTDKQTWRVEIGAEPAVVRVRYRVFANDLSGTFSQFDTSHANLNGASVFMYVAGHKADPLTLTVEAPTDWKLISGFARSTEQRTFPVPNYDRLIDTPLEISAECVLEEFQEAGMSFRVAVHSYAEHDGNLSPLVEGLKKLVRSQRAMMPALDVSHFTFLFHFAPHIALGDGMEHWNSTQIVLRGELAGGGLAEALETASHEFFHAWNVKRLRPAGLGPFDYTREQYTRSLWFAEGVTTYYAYVHLLRSGLWSREKFLARLAEEIRNLEYEPGRALVSAEDSSFHAWFYDRAPQAQETNFANTTISYYNKGTLIALVLDLEIRARTQGRQSLDDVLRAMYERFYEAPAESYFGPGRGYTEQDILETVHAVAASDFTEFFERYVRGTEPLPYAEALAFAGMTLEVKVPEGAPPSLEILTQEVERGVKIAAVRPGGPADLGGLSRGDILLAVDDLSLAATNLKDRLRIYPPGAEVPFTVERHGRRQRITVKLGPPLRDQYSIAESPHATAGQIRLRERWLGAP